jgi:hypothetical protein
MGCFILFDLFILIIFCEENKLFIASLCTFLHPSVIFLLPDPKVIPISLFSSVIKYSKMFFL